MVVTYIVVGKELSRSIEKLGSEFVTSVYNQIETSRMRERGLEVER